MTLVSARNEDHQPDACYNSRQAAHRLGITQETFREWFAKGTLKASRIHGRFFVFESDIRQMMELHSIPTEEH